MNIDYFYNRFALKIITKEKIIPLTYNGCKEHGKCETKFCGHCGKPTKFVSETKTQMSKNILKKIYDHLDFSDAVELDYALINSENDKCWSHIFNGEEFYYGLKINGKDNGNFLVARFDDDFFQEIELDYLNIKYNELHTRFYSIIKTIRELDWIEDVKIVLTAYNKLSF